MPIKPTKAHLKAFVRLLESLPLHQALEHLQIRTKDELCVLNGLASRDFKKVIQQELRRLTP